MFMVSLLAQTDGGDAFSGIDGFLGARGSLMLDIVVSAMLVVLVVMAVSIWQVKYRQRYELHKRIQLTLAFVLLVVIVGFEIDVQYVSQWEHRATASPYFDQDNSWSCPAGMGLVIHLMFAVPTLVLWVAVIYQAWQHFPNPAAPNEHSFTHRRRARLAAFGMTMTAVTGWVFYWLAFVAT